MKSVTAVPALASRPTVADGFVYWLTFLCYRYIQVAKRAGVKVDKLEQMVGSYPPSAQAMTKRFPAEEAPSGMLARGSYNCRSRLTDDDNVVHADFEWKFSIAKDW